MRFFYERDKGVYVIAEVGVNHNGSLEAARKLVEAAVDAGAEIIEKHFTLDRNMEGPDHKASLEPHELKAMISSIRNVSQAMEGDGHKTPNKRELAIAAVARKSVVASRTIRKGEVFSEENLTTRRPGTGLSPMFWDELIGRHASRTFECGAQIAL